LTRGGMGGGGACAGGNSYRHDGVDFGLTSRGYCRSSSRTGFIGLPAVGVSADMESRERFDRLYDPQERAGQGMVWHSGSGDVALDRAAWGSITGSNPLPALPKEFPGRTLDCG